MNFLLHLSFYGFIFSRMVLVLSAFHPFLFILPLIGPLNACQVSSIDVILFDIMFLTVWFMKSMKIFAVMGSWSLLRFSYFGVCVTKPLVDHDLVPCYGCWNQILLIIRFCCWQNFSNLALRSFLCLNRHFANFALKSPIPISCFLKNFIMCFPSW